MKRNEKGFTLIELIVTISIVALIAGGATMSIFQVVKGSERSNNHETAVRQVQNAGYWISHDTQMAQYVDTDDNTGTPETEVLTLTWVGWEWKDHHGNQYIDSYVVRYTCDSNKLQRHQKITTEKYDSSGHFVETTELQDSLLVAEHITALSISSVVDGKLTVTVTASLGETEEERTYEIMLRPSS
jgi:prepilin-type N-terminal cleavage/methylation domain-containing protein